MFSKIVFLHGSPAMSEERKSWIKDFLSLFEIIISERITKNITYYSNEIENIAADKKTLVIGHELYPTQVRYMNDTNISYIDIRISPVRFLKNDFIFALNTNNKHIFKHIYKQKIPEESIFLEAKALALSFRYRNLGQLNIQPNSLVFFIEQEATIDSLNWGLPTSPFKFKKQLLSIISEYEHLYYVNRKYSCDADANFLENIGFTRLDANLYSILASNNIKGICGIRGGVLEEAFYFNKKIEPLAKITTPLCKSKKSIDLFYNLHTNDVMSISFWDKIIENKLFTTRRSSYLNLSQNFLRRALNIWNSSAIAFDYATEEWNGLYNKELIRTSIAVINTLNINNSAFGFDGTWRWFTNDIVNIGKNGVVSSDSDFGIISLKENRYEIHWAIKNIIDFISIDPDNNIIGENQYGDKISATKLTSI